MHSAYNDLDQLLSESDGITHRHYAYDANGNLIARGVADSTTTYLYDITNKLVAAVEPGQSQEAVAYQYDALGNRVWEKSAGGERFYQVDSHNLTGYSQVLAEISAAGKPESFHTYGHDLLCRQHFSGSSLQPSYFHYDGLGSTRLLTGKTGSIENQYAYTAFGSAIGSLTNESHPQPYRFTGERFDNATGYYYLRARYYAPSQGRFTAFDPVEDFNNRLHRYAYCGNDGVNFIDPCGEFILLMMVAILALVAVLINLKLAGLERAFNSLAPPPEIKDYIKQEMDELDDKTRAMPPDRINFISWRGGRGKPVVVAKVNYIREFAPQMKYDETILEANRQLESVKSGLTTIDGKLYGRYVVGNIMFGYLCEQANMDVFFRNAAADWVELWDFDEEPFESPEDLYHFEVGRRISHGMTVEAAMAGNPYARGIGNPRDFAAMGLEPPRPIWKTFRAY